VKKGWCVKRHDSWPFSRGSRLRNWDGVGGGPLFSYDCGVHIFRLPAIVTTPDSGLPQRRECGRWAGRSFLGLEGFHHPAPPPTAGGTHRFHACNLFKKQMSAPPNSSRCGVSVSVIHSGGKGASFRLPSVTSGLTVRYPQKLGLANEPLGRKTRFSGRVLSLGPGGLTASFRLRRTTSLRFKIFSLCVCSASAIGYVPSYS